MKYKLQFDRGNEIIEVIIRDCSGMKIESRKCLLDDPVATSHLMKWLSDKYGFAPIIDNDSNIKNDILAFE